MPLAAKLVFFLAAITLGALALITFMNYAKYMETFDTLLQSRYAVVLADSQESLEAGLTLGLSPDRMDNVEGVLERRLDATSAIAGFAVFDRHGEVLTAIGDLDESVLSALVPGDSLMRSSAPGEAQDLAPVDGAMDSDRFDMVSAPGLDGLGSVLVNNLGQPVGYVSVYYPDTLRADHAAGVLRAMILQAAAILGGVALLGCLALIVVLRPLVHEVHQSDRALRDVLTDGQPAKDPHVARGEGVLSRDIEAFAGQVGQEQASPPESDSAFKGDSASPAARGRA